MSKEDTTITVVEVVMGLIVVFLLFWSVPKMWHWWVRNWQAFNTHLSLEGDVYCQTLKKIVKVDPIFEDNGKYEDESYRVTYEDGSVGLVDQATMQSGYYCVSGTWFAKNTQPKGWVLQP